MDFGDALDRGDGVALKQELHNQLGLLDWQVHAVQGVIAGVREHLTALLALVALAVPAFTKLAAFGTAVVACHCESP
jgi:hypothetical protein